MAALQILLGLALGVGTVFGLTWFVFVYPFGEVSVKPFGWGLAAGLVLGVVAVFLLCWLSWFSWPRD